MHDDLSPEGSESEPSWLRRSRMFVARGHHKPPTEAALAADKASVAPAELRSIFWPSTYKHFAPNGAETCISIR